MRVTLSAIGASSALALVLALLVVAPPPAEPAPLRGCPPGYLSLAEHAAAERRIEAAGRDAASDLRAIADALIDLDPLEQSNLCINQQHPESFEELALRAADRAMPRLAPLGTWRSGAHAAAIAHREQMMQLPVPDGAAGEAEPYGRGPLVVDDPRFGTASLGLADNMGRIDDLEHDLGADPATVGDDRIFAAIGTGGVWLTEDLGENWASLGEELPNQTTSAIAYSPIEGGTLLVLTGEATYGSSSEVGTGVYFTRDLGETWTKAEGVPDGVLGFAAEAHPNRPEEFYVATSVGLFKSTDGGETFAVVPMPVGPTTDGGEPCDGVTDLSARPDCTFANHVTDVAIQAPGGTNDIGDEPVIVAAVGWRGGQRVEPGTEVTQSPSNGIYRSTDGGNTFTYVPPPATEQPNAFAEAERIGRTELGAATGPDQNHGYLYAIVQDAVALNGGVNTIDAPLGDQVDEPVPYNTVLEGVYVSSNFGASWVKVADDQDFQSPTSGSGLIGTVALGFAPGIQAWYNLCVEPDPTQADPITGAPTRLIVCLEEVWQNDDLETGARGPVIGPTSFKVIGRYFSGATCAFLLQLEPCPTDRPPGNTLTTHPDQHAALFVPIPEGDPNAPEGSAGGVALMMGNDGGFYSQATTGEFDNGAWGAGRNDGFNTLLPYHARTAKDNTVWFGLQDNGSGMVDPRPNPAEEGVEDPRDGQELLQYEVIGGDGFYVAVDPDNSDVAYTERPFASMTVTTDRGVTHSALSPPITGGQFSNPFVMDPTNARHLLTAGCEVVETTFGPGTGGFPGFDWVEVFQLGAADGGPCGDEGTEPFNNVSAVDLERDAAYVGFCGVCDILNTDEPFRNGLATNVAGEDVAQRLTSQGWHFAAAEGLPNRYITSIEIDPQDVRTIYVTLGGYTRAWTPTGSLGDDNADVGEGHLFVSRDAGETFTDITSNLPDLTATWVALRGARQLIVGTDIGAFLTGSAGVVDDQSFVPMRGLPHASIGNIEVTPHDQDLLTIAIYGRGIYQYSFVDEIDAIDYRRVAGLERIETSAETSQEQFPRGTGTVVLARADAYADALVAVPLAFQENAPILLSYPEGLHPTASAEITRLGATRAILIGDALSAGVESDLAELGINDVVRYGGPDVFATAAAVAGQLVGSDDVTPQAYIVEGEDPDPARGWPDTMAIGPLAATQGRPILLVTTESAPAATMQAIADLGVEEVTVVGGTVAVSDAVRAQLEEAGVTVKEIAGSNRYETSAAIANVAVTDHLDERRLWLATGDNYPDALSSGSSVALNGGVLLLVPRDDLDDAPASRRFIREHSDDLQIVRFLGGIAAISQDVEDQVVAAIAEGLPPVEEPPPLVGEVVAGPFGFETGAEGWEEFHTEDVTMWRVGPPGDASAQSFQIAPYNNEASAVLVSPPFEHAGGLLRVTWSQRTNTEDGFDFLSLGWAGSGRANVVAGFSGLNADYPGFTPQEAVFEAPAGEVRIFFRLATDQLVNGEGVNVDNVAIER